jgi:hypothetical protein
LRHFGENNFCLDNAYGVSAGTWNADQLRPYNQPPSWALDDSTESKVSLSDGSPRDDQVPDKVDNYSTVPEIDVNLHDALPIPDVASRPHRTIKRPGRYLDYYMTQNFSLLLQSAS